MYIFRPYFYWDDKVLVSDLYELFVYYGYKCFVDDTSHFNLAYGVS